MSFCKPCRVALVMAAVAVVAFALIFIKDGLFFGKEEVRSVVVEGHIYYPKKGTDEETELGILKKAPASLHPEGSDTYMVSSQMRHGYLLVRDPIDSKQYRLPCYMEPWNSLPYGATATTTFILNFSGEVTKVFSPCR